MANLFLTCQARLCWYNSAILTTETILKNEQAFKKFMGGPIAFKGWRTGEEVQDERRPGDEHADDQRPKRAGPAWLAHRFGLCGIT